VWLNEKIAPELLPYESEAVEGLLEAVREQACLRKKLLSPPGAHALLACRRVSAAVPLHSHTHDTTFLNLKFFIVTFPPQEDAAKAGAEGDSTSKFMYNVYHMELDRIKFLISSYLRTRLWKVGESCDGRPFVSTALYAEYSHVIGGHDDGKLILISLFVPPCAAD
jgi:hypothetical protein